MRLTFTEHIFSRRCILVPCSMWILLSGVVCLSFITLMRYGRVVSYGSLAVLIPLAAVCFRNAMTSFFSYSEMMLDHDACAE